MKRLAFAARFGARHAWLWRHRQRIGEQGREQPRLLVDVSAIIHHDAQTGIQRVVRAVWSELRQRHGHGIEVAPVYATHSRGYCYAPLDFLEARPNDLPRVPVRARANDRFLGLDLSAHFLPKYRRQLRAWRAHGVTIHMIVYDVLPLLKPQWFSSTAVVNFRNWFRLLTEDVDQAICISRQVSRDLRECVRDRAPLSTLSIASMQMGGDIASTRPSEGVCGEVSNLIDRLRFRPAILMVGTIEPRKGHAAALPAFELLWRTRGSEAPDLVIVGKPAALQKYIQSHPERGRRLHWLDQVSDEGLGRLYEASRGLLVASHAEGFGLPLAEAITQRRPVLARDLAVFREQNLPSVLFFEDDRPAALSERLMDLLKIGPLPANMKPDFPTWSSSVDGLLHELGISTPARTEPLTYKEAIARQE